METAGCEQDYPRWLTDEFREVNAAGEKIPRSTAARGERLARIPATARPSLRQAALESLRWHKKRARSAPCPFIAPGLRARLSAGARQGMHPALHAACTGLLVFVGIVVGVALIAMFAGRVTSINNGSDSFAIADLTMRSRLILIGVCVCTAAVLVKTLYHLRRLLDNYSRRQIFTANSAREIRQFGISCILWGMVKIIWAFLPMIL